MRKNTFLFFLVAVLLLPAGIAVAQQKTISGTVKDTSGNGLPSIAVTVKGTNNSALTDALGNFRINLPSENSTLVVSAIGFNAEEISTAGKNLITVVLQQKNDELSEVIVTGFGTRTNTRKLAYAVQEIKGEDITKTNNANIVNSIQGKVAGVMVNQGVGGPQSGSRIRIRGNTSLPNSLSTSSNNTQPLFVIDGVLIRPNTGGADSWGSNQDMGNIVKNLNPDDFASYTVLKGSSATALYGSDGQNGVILITTKKGVARKGLGVSVSHTQSFDKAYKLYDLQNEYGSGIDPTFAQVGGVDAIDPNWGQYFSYGPKFNNQQVRDLDGRMFTYKANDPLSFFQTGRYVNTNVAVEGGNERSTFRFSYSNLSNSSVMPRNKMGRNNLNIRATQKLGSIINMDVSVNYTATESDNPLPNGGNSNPLFAFVYNGTRSTDLDYWYNNYIDTAIGGRKSGGAKNPYGLATPMWELKEWTIKQKEENIRANMDLTANITSWLSILGRVNINRLSENFESKKRGQAAGFLGNLAEYRLRQSNNNDLRFQGLLNANKELGKDLTLSTSVGGETNRSLGGQYAESTTKNGFQLADRYVISNSSDPATVTARFNPRKRTDAIYAYGDLTWKDMLTLSFSARNDWNSTLTYANGVGDYSYFYPSVGLAYVFTEMPSFKSKTISFGKLRASYGYTGFGTDAYTANKTGQYKRGIPDGPSDFVTIFPPPDGIIPMYTFADLTLPNYALKNQLTKEMEFGAELRFFENRLGVDVAYYKKNTYNQIFPIPVAAESGVTNRLVNAGNVQNQGIEIVLTGSPIRTRNFQWNTVVNFTRNRNKVIELVDGLSPYELELGFGADVKAVAIPGGDYGILQTSYGYAYYQKRDNEGKPVAHPNNGKKVIGDPANADFGMTFLRTGQYDGTTKNLGTIMEKFLLSNINNFNYKNFTFGFQVDAKVGGLMGSGTHQYGSANGSLKNSLFGRDEEHGGITFTDDLGVVRHDGIIPDGVFQDGYISPIDMSTDMGGMTFQDAYDQGLVKPKPAYQYYDDLSNWGGGIREYSIFENTWVSLREISAGYNLPQSFTKKLAFQSLRISAVVRNLTYLYKTAPDGINPEGIYSNRAAAFMEYGGMPYVRSFGFTLNGSF